MKARWYEPARRTYDKPQRASCGCPVAGPDEYGQFELMPRWNCSVHGEAREERK